MKIKTVIIPCAGEGTRWRPYTNVVPKELLPVLNQPAIDVVINECLSNGIEKFVFVINDAKYTLVEYLHRRNIDSIFVYQTEPKGLADAILMAEPTVFDDYFMVALPDMIHKKQWLEPMLKGFNREFDAIVALHRINENTEAYGIADPYKFTGYNEMQRIRKVKEKPKGLLGYQAMISGRYVFHQGLFKQLQQKPDLTKFFNDSENKVYGYLNNSLIGDVGTVPQWVKTVNKLYEDTM